MKFWCSKF